MRSIYLVRYAFASYFDYRLSNTDAYIAKLNKERDATINRLKEATKYNSTQQLLEKYGASPKQETPQPSPNITKAQGPQKPQQSQGPRTGMAPPPTANIQRPQNQSSNPSTPQRSPLIGASPQGAVQRPPTPGAEFAPNAFGPVDSTTQYSAAPAASFAQFHWYDRILDALLGEDETQPKNRLALICSECRLERLSTTGRPHGRRRRQMALRRLQGVEWEREAARGDCQLGAELGRGAQSEGC